MPRKLLLAMILAAVLVLVALAQGAIGHPHSRACPDCALPDAGFRHHFHSRPAEPVPTRVGQDLLGAVQEVVGLLLADPGTDWSEISIARLRRHLVDLNELMLHADAEEREVAGGLEVVVRGPDRALAAVRRLVPAHAGKMAGFRDWRVAARDDGDAVTLRLTSDDGAEVEILRALGFFGFMASGVHHPHQLLAVARGRSAHWPDPTLD